MATYVNDLRLKEIATGDEAGTWGTSTNTNLELIGEALGYGTQDCFASDADATTTVADGASDPARAMYFKVTSSATLTATRTLTIAPNTISRVMLIENATTGSQSITISQGSGSNVTIASGAVKMVYLDGAGAGGAVVEALSDLELPTVTVADLTATTADINGGTIDGTVIGGSTPAAVTTSSLVATTADINAGTIDGTVIGGSTAAAITGTTITGTSFVSSGDMTFGDNDKAIFGAGSDLKLYHTGSHSYIDENGTGNLYIGSNNGAGVYIQGSGETLASFVDDGAVTLYHDNAAKLATTATGIDVTGTVTADGLIVSGDSTIGGSSATSNVLLDLVEPTSTSDVILGLSANGSNRTQVRTTQGLGTSSDLRLLTVDSGSTRERFKIDSNGDISFYEDTGTTAKFFWDASAESLGIGAGSPTTSLTLGTGTTGVSFQSGSLALNSGKIAVIKPIELGTGNGHLVFETYQGGSGGGERMRIDSSGQTQVVGYDAMTLGFPAIAGGASRSGIKPTVTGAGAGQLQFLVGGDNTTEATTIAAMLDASGNLLLGQTSSLAPASDNVVGAAIAPSGYISTNRAGVSAEFGRSSSDGDIAVFRKDGTSVGSIGAAGGNIYIGQGDTTIMFSASSDAILPKGTDGADRDNAIDLGQAAVNRFNDAFITNGVTTGSDGNDKQDIEELTEAEQRVAVACKGLLRKWRWKDAVEEKGDEARIHFGIIAQDLQAAFEAEGLDAGRYAMFMSNNWTDKETGEERTRLGVRYHELLAFIIAAI